MAVIPLPGVFLALVVGLLADRFGRRPVVVICLLIFGAAGLASSLAPTFKLLLLARFLQGFGSAGLLNLAIVLIADYWEGQKRTTIMGRNSAALATCLVVIPPFSGLLAETTSWRWSLALTTFAIPLAWAAARSLPSQSPFEPHSLSCHLRELGASLRSPLVLATLFSGFTLFAVIFGVFLTTLPIHLDQMYGLEAGARGAVLAAPAISSVLAALYLGRISNVASRKSILVVSGFLISCSALAMGITDTLWIIVAASLIYGLGDGVLIPTLQDMAATSVPASQRASVLALWTSFVRLGQLTGPLAAGLIITWSSTEAVMIIGSIAFGMVSLFWIWASFDLAPEQPD